VLAPLACKTDRINAWVLADLDALQFIRFGIAPSRRRYASAKVDQLLFGNVDMEGADLDRAFDVVLTTTSVCR
jgi:hypothetical protein